MLCFATLAEARAGGRGARLTNLTAVLIIVICAAVAAAGCVLATRWSRDAPPKLPPGRYAAVCLAAGATAGVIAAGAGGRVVMRLLAVTSPEEADGALTEAQARIGEITLGGTLGLVFFSGIPAGILAGALYALAGPLLPRGRAGGLAIGAILLVLLGWLLEPLRADNFDFNLVGPDWLSVLAFTALALFLGVLTVALVARLTRGVPPLRLRPRTVLAGRIVLAVVVLAALPFFTGAVADILSG